MENFESDDEFAIRELTEEEVLAISGAAANCTRTPIGAAFTAAACF
ncbi:hypothetical protein [Burkholderia gladioli]|nr:hypothetical protein [Burkholderia gladioli]MDN7726530.1 hypothetical protein [Burkholderia gladioli]